MKGNIKAVIILLFVLALSLNLDNVIGLKLTILEKD